MTKLTIGMPVYNGAATLSSALDSLLAQTYRDFQIVISDNASTDETQKIGEAYAARDARIRYVRQAKNVGPVLNFRFVLFQTDTPYFMWAAADDYWAPTFVEQNLAILDVDPSIVLCQSKVLFCTGGVPTHLSTGTAALAGSIRENMATFFANPADNSRYYGIFRSDVLKQVFPTRSFFAADWAVSGSTLKFGSHAEIPDVLMIRDLSDAMNYERSIARDHSSKFMQIFPVFFMTQWFMKNNARYITPSLLYSLLKLNLYIHFRFGLYKVGAVADRYLSSSSITHGLFGGAAASISRWVRPGLIRRAFHSVVGLGRRTWRKLPISMEQRIAMKSAILARYGRHFRSAGLYNDWLEVAEAPAAVALSYPLVTRDWRLPVSSGEPVALTLIVPYQHDVVGLLSFLNSVAHLENGGNAEVIVISSTPDVIPEATASAPSVRIMPVMGASSPVAVLQSAIDIAKAPYVAILPANATLASDFIEQAVKNLADANLVAPQACFPDGRIASAGALLQGDTLPSPLGASKNPKHTRFNYVRAVDCAPHGLIAAKDCFAKVPLDAAFKTIHAALMDWCLVGRLTLGPVTYHPSLRLTVPLDEHGTTHEGRDRSLQEDMFYLRRKNENSLRVLETMARVNGSIQDATKPLRMLYVDADTPAPDQNAGSIFAWNLMKIFGSLGFRVTFVPESNFVHRGHYTSNLQNLGVEAIYRPFAASVEDVLHSAESPFDVVVLCRADIARRYTDVVRALMPLAKIIFNTVDLHYLREEREANLRNDARALAAALETKTSEFESIRKSDATIVVSSYEQSVLVKELPNAPVHVIPLVFDDPDVKPDANLQTRRDIVFMGTYQHPPNEDAVLYFISEIWPRVKERVTDASFKIVGSSATPRVEALAGDRVDVLGFVEDLDPVLRHCRVSVAPVRFGAGLKGKLASAMLASVPVVATSIAAEGMALVDGADILIADDPDAFAEHVIRLFEDDELWHRLTEGGFAFVQRELTVSANVGRISRILSGVGLTSYAIDFNVAKDLLKNSKTYLPSQFWNNLVRENSATLEGEKIFWFKRTVNNNYMQWLPGDFNDPRMKSVYEAFNAKPSLAPIEVVADSTSDPSLPFDVVGYGGFSPFSTKNYTTFYKFYVGLLWQLAASHDAQGLHLNLSEPSLGAPIPVKLGRKAISQDLASSILEFSRVTELQRAVPSLPSRRVCYLEIGAGYGRLASVFLSATQDCRYVIVDIPPALVLAKWYLSHLYPDRSVFGLRNFNSFDEVAEDIAKADIVFLLPHQLDLIPDGFVHVSISISSLHEMSPSQVRHYKEAIAVKTSDIVYFKQWRSWRNPVDELTVTRDDYLLPRDWSLVLDTVDLANGEFIELGWLRKSAPGPRRERESKVVAYKNHIKSALRR